MTHRLSERQALVPAILLAPFLVLAVIVPAQAKDQVNVGLNVSWPGFSMLKVAQEKGLAEEYDLNITIFEDPLGGHAALAAGQIDVYLSTAEYTPFTIARDTDVALVSLLNISYGVDKVVMTREMTSEELKGRKVAAPQAYIGEILVGMWLDSIELVPDDVNWVNLNADEAVGPAMSGDLAAAYMYEPWVTRVLDNLEEARVVADTREPRYLNTGIFMDAMYMNTEFIANNRRAAKDMIKARFQGVQYWHDHTAETNKLFSEFLQWSVADVESVVGTNGKYLEDGLYMMDFNEVARICGALEGSPPHGLKNDSMLDNVKRTNEWWVKLGLMDEVYDPAEGVDCSLTAELVDEGFRQSMSAHD